MEPWIEDRAAYFAALDRERDRMSAADAEPTFPEHAAAAVDLVREHPGVDHLWLNAFRCIRPTDEFAAEVGRTVISKVMAQKHDDVFKRRHIVLRVNAS